MKTRNQHSLFRIWYTRKAPQKDFNVTTSQRNYVKQNFTITTESQTAEQHKFEFCREINSQNKKQLHHKLN